LIDQHRYGGWSLRLGTSTYIEPVSMNSNQVSDARDTDIENSRQRLASEIGRLRRKIQKITRQRLRDISLTLRNVASIFANRNMAQRDPTAWLAM